MEDPTLMFEATADMVVSAGRVTIKTNGYHGGDAGHGGFIDFAIEGARGLWLSENGELQDVNSVQFRLGGDYEIAEVVDCLCRLLVNVKKFLKFSAEARGRLDLCEVIEMKIVDMTTELARYES
jgi:hypothetical protein